MCLEFLVPRNCYAAIVNCNKECESRGIKDWEINIEIIHLNSELKLNNFCKHGCLKINVKGFERWYIYYKKKSDLLTCYIKTPVYILKEEE